VDNCRLTYLWRFASSHPPYLGVFRLDLAIPLLTQCYPKLYSLFHKSQMCLWMCGLPDCIHRLWISFCMTSPLSVDSFPCWVNVRVAAQSGP